MGTEYNKIDYLNILDASFDYFLKDVSKLALLDTFPNLVEQIYNYTIINKILIILAEITENGYATNETKKKIEDLLYTYDYTYLKTYANKKIIYNFAKVFYYNNFLLAFEGNCICIYTVENNSLILRYLYHYDTIYHPNIYSIIINYFKKKQIIFKCHVFERQWGYIDDNKTFRIDPLYPIYKEPIINLELAKNTINTIILQIYSARNIKVNKPFIPAEIIKYTFNTFLMNGSK